MKRNKKKQKTIEQKLRKQLAKENKQLKALRSFLPGYEPDRWNWNKN